MYRTSIYSEDQGFAVRVKLDYDQYSPLSPISVEDASQMTG